MSIEFKLHDVTDITLEAFTDFVQALHAHRFSFTEAGDDIAYSGLFGQYFREYPDNKTGYIRTPCHVL